MVQSEKDSWFSRAENCWLAVSVGLGISNLFLLLMLWNVSGAAPKTDTLAISLTILQTFLVVVALGGFFIVRGAAMRKAEEEATIVAERIVKRELRDTLQPLLARSVRDYLSLSDVDYDRLSTKNSMNELMQALDDGGEDA